MKVAELGFRSRPSEDGAHNSNYSPRKRNGWWVSQPSTWHLPSTSNTPSAGHEGEFTDILLVFRLLSVWFLSDKDSHGGN